MKYIVHPDGLPPVIFKGLYNYSDLDNEVADINEITIKEK